MTNPGIAWKSIFCLFCHCGPSVDANLEKKISPKLQALQAGLLHCRNTHHPYQGARRPLWCGNALTVTQVVETTPLQPKRNPARCLHFTLLLLLCLSSHPYGAHALLIIHPLNPLSRTKKRKTLIGVMTSWLLVLITVKKCTENFSPDILSALTSAAVVPNCDNEEEKVNFMSSAVQ